MINFTGGIVKINGSYIPTSNIVGIVQGQEGTVINYKNPITKPSGEVGHTAKSSTMSAQKIAEAYVKAEQTNDIVDVFA